MIHLLVGLPLVDVGGFRASAYDTQFNELGEEVAAGSFALYADAPVHRFRRLDLRLYTGGGLQSLRYEAPGLSFDGATWDLLAELGPAWTIGDGAVRGFAELGLGVSGRLGLPDYADAVAVFGVSGHGAVGVTFGRGPLAGVVAFRTDSVGSLASASGDILLPDGSLSWYWTASTFRAVVSAGVAFGGGPDAR